MAPKSTEIGTKIYENGAWAIFNQPVQPTVRWEAVVVFGGALSQNVIPEGHFGTLEVDKIDTKIDSEKVSKNNTQIIRQWSQNDREIDDRIDSSAKE